MSSTGHHLATCLPPPLLASPSIQAYAEAAAALGGRELTTEERWGVAVALVAALGDAASALRLAGEPNNQYRLVRVVDILLQSGGVPLAGELQQASE